MSQENNKNKVFTDYAAIVQGLLPETQGLLFHSHIGRLFWRDDRVDNEILTEDYKAALQSLLLSRAYDPINCRVMMEGHVAYLLPITTDNADLLGALTVLLPSDSADLPYKKCHELVLPALSALGRELILRRNLTELKNAADFSIAQRIDDLQMIGSVRSAIQNGRLTLFAQPVVRLDGDSSLAYHEILVRMIDDNGNPVEPHEFLGAAERYQLMKELDEWVVTNAIRSLTNHENKTETFPLRLAINLSGQSIGNEQFLAFLKTELAKPGVPTERLCFEVTETVAVQNADKARAFMEEIVILGCEFALDDFGIGQSSFSYLKMFPIRKLKIDGSFIADICDNPVSHVMVKAIADIARVMKIETVAEYVQEETVLEVIREIGIDWAQGYLIGAPIQLGDLLGAYEFEDAANKSELPI